MASEEGSALTLGQLRVCVDTGRIMEETAGIDVQPIVETLHQQPDLGNLLPSIHDFPRGLLDWPPRVFSLARSAANMAGLSTSARRLP